MKGDGRNRWLARPLLAGAVACLFGLVLAAGSREPAAPSGLSISVTFDDLPVASVTPIDASARRDLTRRLLSDLARLRVPAIGFVNEYGLHGFARQPGPAPDPDGVGLLQMWLDAGFDLGNHGFAHADLHAHTVAAFTEDITRGEAVTGRLLQSKGERLRYFRHPYLHTGRDLAAKRQVGQFLAERGYRMAPVTVDNEDYLFAAAYSRAAARGDEDLMRRVAGAYIDYTESAFVHSEQLASRLFGRPIRHVLLLHANALNAAHFDALAGMMRRRGYTFVSLDEALRDPAYESPDRYVGAESINWLGRWAITRGVKNEEDILDDIPDVPSFVSTAAAER